MSEVIILLVFVFLSVIGIGNLCEKLWLFLVKPQRKNKTFLITYLPKEECDDTFLYYFEKYRWEGKEYADYLVFLKEEPVSEKISAYLKENENIICCKERQLLGILKNKQEYKDG